MRSLNDIDGVSVEVSQEKKTIYIEYETQRSLDFKFVWSNDHYIGYFMDNEGNYHVHELKTGMWKDKKTKYESMAKEMAFYVYMLKKSTQPDFGGVSVSYWGWDHTKAMRTTPTRFTDTLNT